MAVQTKQSVIFQTNFHFFFYQKISKTNRQPKEVKKKTTDNLNK